MEKVSSRKLPRCVFVVAVMCMLLVALLIAYCTGAASSAFQADDAEASHAISSVDEATSAVEANCGEYANSQLSSLLEFAEISGVEKNELENAGFGKPFTIVQIDDLDKAITYYCPIVDNDTGKVLCVAGLWQTSNGWSYDMSTEYAAELNGIDYSNGSYIFYAHDMSIMADDGQHAVLFSGKPDEELESYAQKSTAEKLDDLSYVIESAHVLDIDSIRSGTSEGSIVYDD